MNAEIASETRRSRAHTATTGSGCAARSLVLTSVPAGPFAAESGPFSPSEWPVGGAAGGAVDDTWCCASVGTSDGKSGIVVPFYPTIRSCQVVACPRFPVHALSRPNNVLQYQFVNHRQS